MSKVSYNELKQIIKEVFSSSSEFLGEEHLHLKIIKETIKENIKPDDNNIDKVSDILANKIIKNYDKIEIILNSQDKQKVLSIIECIIDDYDESIDSCDAVINLLREAYTYLEDMKKIKQKIDELQSDKSTRNEAILKIMEDNIPYSLRNNDKLAILLDDIEEVVNRKFENINEELDFCNSAIDNVKGFVKEVKPLLEHEQNPNPEIEKQIRALEDEMELEIFIEMINDMSFDTDDTISDEESEDTDTDSLPMKFVKSHIIILDKTWNILTTRFVKCHYKSIIKL